MRVTHVSALLLLMSAFTTYVYTRHVADDAACYWLPHDIPNSYATSRQQRRRRCATLADFPFADAAPQARRT